MSKSSSFSLPNPSVLLLFVTACLWLAMIPSSSALPTNSSITSGINKRDDFPCPAEKKFRYEELKAPDGHVVGGYNVPFWTLACPNGRVVEFNTVENCFRNGDRDFSCAERKDGGALGSCNRSSLRFDNDKHELSVDCNNGPKTVSLGKCMKYVPDHPDVIQCING